MQGGQLEIIAILAVLGVFVVVGLYLFAQVLAAARVQEAVHREAYGDVAYLPAEAKAAGSSKNKAAGGRSSTKQPPADAQVMSLTHDGRSL